MPSQRTEFNLANHFGSMIETLGYELDEPHLQNTPERAARHWLEVTTHNDHVNHLDVLTPIWEESYESPVIVTGIEFSSTCPHHLLPFLGRATIGYLPDGKVVGLSKLARLVVMESRGLQLQEEMTTRIVDHLVEAVNPRGAAIYLKAQHTCMSTRGALARGSNTITYHFYGDMAEAPYRQEFMMEAQNDCLER